MESAAQQKAWMAKIFGSCYFILLGFTYAIMELVSGHFSFADLCVLLWACLPILINKRWLYVVFGGVNLLVWSYIALGMMVISGGDAVGLLFMAIITAGAVVASLLLIYSAISISEKRFSLI
ncbi:hypothetical protein FLLO111716_04510 [Flavobacterium longum]|uniref:hypothetical protein n=1 Tax=Flavobacterium longum TaxID=1299340 RepID=UPI0039E92D04